MNTFLEPGAVRIKENRGEAQRVRSHEMGCVTTWALLTMSSEIRPIIGQGTCFAMWESCTQAILCNSPSEGEKENLSAGSLSAISKRLPQMDWSGLGLFSRYSGHSATRASEPGNGNRSQRLWGWLSSSREAKGAHRESAGVA